MNGNSIDKIEEISLLLDFYGDLISEKQREYLRLYHEDNCSLSEIGEICGISRQGVYDGVRKAQGALREYEEKLGLVAEYKDRAALIASVCESIDGLMKRAGSSEIREELADIKAAVKRLDR